MEASTDSILQELRWKLKLAQLAYSEIQKVLRLHKLNANGIVFPSEEVAYMLEQCVADVKRLEEDAATLV